MIIDAHQHFWNYDPVAHSWIDDSMALLKQNFGPEELISAGKPEGVVGSIAVQADQSDLETDFLLGLAAEYDFIKGVVGWVDIRSEDLTEKLSGISNKKLAGFRHVIQDEPDVNFILQRDFQRGIGLLEQFGYTYDILIFPTQLAGAIRTVRNFPNQKFVVDHIAKPYIKSREIDQWKKSMIEMAKSENTWCKISGMATEADWQNWKYEDFIPYLDVIVDAFGTNRIMFGSDWPVCLLGGSYSEIKRIPDRYFSAFSRQEQEKIFLQNTIDFYGVEP